ncbi:MAG: hypothetical protein D6698_15870 [Gammaproteobacteria bacterium]|nr:MAG: hypothetical protein D6698_15870 [Gammaproteobacteria bacterium]
MNHAEKLFQDGRSLLEQDHITKSNYDNFYRRVFDSINRDVDRIHLKFMDTRTQLELSPAEREVLNNLYLSPLPTNCPTPLDEALERVDTSRDVYREVMALKARWEPVRDILRQVWRLAEDTRNPE